MQSAYSHYVTWTTYNMVTLELLNIDWSTGVNCKQNITKYKIDHDDNAKNDKRIIYHSCDIMFMIKSNQTLSNLIKHSLLSNNKA